MRDPTPPSRALSIEIFVAFVEVFQSTAFNEKFSLNSFNSIAFLQWVHEEQVSDARRIQSRITEKAGRRTYGKQFGSLVKEKHPSWRERGTDQVRRVLRRALAFEIYSLKDVHINFIFKGCSARHAQSANDHTNIAVLPSSGLCRVPGQERDLRYEPEFERCMKSLPCSSKCSRGVGILIRKRMHISFPDSM